MEPNICVFSIGLHSALSTFADLGGVWVGLLIGWSVRRIILNPSLFVEVAKDSRAVVQG